MCAGLKQQQQQQCALSKIKQQHALRQRSNDFVKRREKIPAHPFG
jgi:hypothetical protein